MNVYIQNQNICCIFEPHAMTCPRLDFGQRLRLRIADRTKPGPNFPLKITMGQIWVLKLEKMLGQKKETELVLNFMKIPMRQKFV